MKRLCLLLIVIAVTLTALPTVGLAEDEIAVTFSGAQAQFPLAITFYLEAESTNEIIDIDLEYRVKRQSLVPISCRVSVDFTQGQRVSASWTWDMLQTGGLPPGIEVEYWWLIEDATGYRIETSPATVQFDDLRYDWDSLTSDRVTLYWYEGGQTFAQELIDAADEALERLASDTGVSLEPPAKFFIYASFWDLLGALVYPDIWTGGIAFPGYGIIVIGVPPDDPAWGRRVIAHELGHLVVHQAVSGPYGALPNWLDEGLAMDAEGEFRSDLHSQLDEAIANDALFSVRSISSSFPADPEEAKLCYAESYSLVQFLIDRYGSDKILELLDAFKRGSTYDDALVEVYGFDMDGLNDRWRESLGLGPPASPTITPTPTPTEAGSGLSYPYIALIVVLAILGILSVYLAFSFLRRTR